MKDIKVILIKVISTDGNNNLNIIVILIKVILTNNNNLNIKVISKDYFDR